MSWVLLVGLLFVIVTVCIPSAIRAEANMASFEERFPPITEEAFVAACAPGTPRFVALGVRRTIAECLAVDYERIHPCARLAADLGAE
jgi:hypothetical protein